MSDGIYVEVHFDAARVKARVEAANKEATPIITNEFIKDSNYYCREDTGELERSAIRASRPEEGLAIWDTPYAKKMYYTGTPSRDRNPNASLMWGHKAARKNKAKYARMAQAIANKKV